MKIGIDARLYSQTGVGRYIRNLIRVLGEIDKENDYVVFLIKEDRNKFIPPNKRWQIKITNIHWHTFSEQLLMPILLNREKLDLVHFPYFNVPILYFKPFMVTIHDLTHLHFDTGRASTLPAIFYRVKRIGLKIALWWAINKSKKIIAVSEATQNEILKNYRVKSEKIVVVYEGTEGPEGTESESLKEKTPNVKLVENNPYLLYVGNAYPHKNLERLILAYKELISTNQQWNKLRLILVGPNDFFYQKLKNFVKDNNLDRKVIFYGSASDQELDLLYKEAIYLVLPSLMEGFGLVGLEAMSQNCPVLASDTPSLREIYQNAALYFNPRDQNDLKNKIQILINDKTEREKLIEEGKKRVSFFSWKKMGKQTLEIYEKVIK